MNVLGSRLRRCRLLLDLRQEDVSLMLKLPRSVLSRYENGRNVPSVSVLVKLADYYGVSVDYLCGRVFLSELSGFSPTLLPCKRASNAQSRSVHPES